MWIFCNCTDISQCDMIIITAIYYVWFAVMLYIYFLLLCKLLYSYYVISLTKVYKITFFDDVTAKVLKTFFVVIDPSRPCKHRQCLKPLDMKLILIIIQSSLKGSKHITFSDFSESKKIEEWCCHSFVASSSFGNVFFFCLNAIYLSPFYPCWPCACFDMWPTGRPQWVLFVPFDIVLIIKHLLFIVALTHHLGQPASEAISASDLLT